MKQQALISVLMTTGFAFVMATANANDDYLEYSSETDMDISYEDPYAIDESEVQFADEWSETETGYGMEDVYEPVEEAIEDTHSTEAPLEIPGDIADSVEGHTRSVVETAQGTVQGVGAQAQETAQTVEQTVKHVPVVLEQTAVKTVDMTKQKVNGKAANASARVNLKINSYQQKLNAKINSKLASLFD